MAFAVGVGLLLFAPVPAWAAGPTNGNPFDRVVQGVAVGEKLPETRFIDQAGHAASLADWRGRTLVIAFVYTHCTDQCPLVTNKFARLATMLPHDRFRLLEVSIDPARDTPDVIARYAREHHVDGSVWSVLTGDSEALDRFERSMGISVVTAPGGELLHNERTVVVAPDGTLASVIDEAGWTTEQVAAEARHVEGLPSNAFARLDLNLGKAVAAICGGALQGRAGLGDAIAVVAIFAIAGIVAFIIARKLFAG
jgi:protein SCO1